MTSFFTILFQKFMSGAKKSLWIHFRKKNGAWEDFLLPPSNREFKRGNTTYLIAGVPEIDNFTNQRRYYYLEGISDPIAFHSAHPNLIAINKEQGNINLMLGEAEETAYQKALLLKNKSGFDPIWIAVGVSALTFLIVAADKLGVFK